MVKHISYNRSYWNPARPADSHSLLPGSVNGLLPTLLFHTIVSPPRLACYFILNPSLSTILLSHKTDKFGLQSLQECPLVSDETGNLGNNLNLSRGITSTIHV